MGKAPRDTFGRSASKPPAQSGGPRFLAGPAPSPKSSKKLDQGKRSSVPSKKTGGKLFSMKGKKA